MINFLLKNPSLYRFYQTTVRAKYSEYDFFTFIFKQNNFKKIRMLDICCGDGHILEYINEFIEEYVGIDNNDKYLEQCRSRWKKFNFINLELKDNINIDPLIEFKPNFIFINGAIHHLDGKTVKLINSFIKSNFSECYFLSVDPVRYNNALLNKIMIMLDRGKFIRSKSEYAELMNSFESFIVDDFYKMKFQNIFHYKNFDLKELYQQWKKEVS